MQIMKTTANNTSGSGIRAAKREENSFNLIVGSRHAGYSWVSHEVFGS